MLFLLYIFDFLTVNIKWYDYRTSQQSNGKKNFGGCPIKIHSIVRLVAYVNIKIQFGKCTDIFE